MPPVPAYAVGRFAPRPEHAASPLSCNQPAGLSFSARGSASPRAGSRNVGQRRRRAATHGAALPLRPHAALLHKAAFWKVAGSRCAKAALGASHRCAPSRVSKIGLMQSGLRSAAGASAVSAPRSLARPPRCRLCALGACSAWGCLVRRFAQCSSQWPSAIMWCLPPPTLGLAAARHWPARGLPVRPQGGSLSPRALRLSQ